MLWPEWAGYALPALRFLTLRELATGGSKTRPTRVETRPMTASKDDGVAHTSSGEGRHLLYDTTISRCANAGRWQNPTARQTDSEAPGNENPRRGGGWRRAIRVQPCPIVVCPKMSALPMTRAASAAAGRWLPAWLHSSHVTTLELPSKAAPLFLCYLRLTPKRAWLSRAPHHHLPSGQPVPTKKSPAYGFRSLDRRLRYSSTFQIGHHSSTHFCTNVEPFFYSFGHQRLHRRSSPDCVGKKHPPILLPS